MVDELKLQASIDEEDEEITASNSYLGNKGEDVVEQKPVVVPPFFMPIVDLIKVDEECVYTCETFTKPKEPMVDGKKVT